MVAIVADCHAVARAHSGAAATSVRRPRGIARGSAVLPCQLAYGKAKKQARGRKGFTLTCNCSSDASAFVSVVTEPAAKLGGGGHSQRILKELQGVTTMAEAREVVDREINNFSPANCSTSLKIIGQLTRGMSHRESRALGSDPLVLRLQEAVVLQLDRMKPQQLADVVWAFGRMGHNPGPLLDLVAKKSVEQIADFRMADISKVMWAHAKLNYLPRDLFDAISATLAENAEWKTALSSGTPIALSNMVWACGKLKYSNVGLLDCLATLCLAKFDEFTPQSISNTVWGFAVLKYCSGELLDTAAATAEAQVDAFSTANLVNLIWSYGSLGYAPPCLTSTLIPEAGLRMKRGNPQDVSNLAVTCARLGVAPPEVMDAVANRAMDTLAAFKAEEYAGLIWAFATLRYNPPCPLFAELRAKLAEKARRCTGREVSTMLWAFSRIDKKLRPEELGCLVVRAGELLPTMNNGDAAGVLGALARLSPDIPPSQSIAALVDTAWSRFSGEALDAVPDAELPALLWAFCRLHRKVKHFEPADKGKWAGQGKRRRLPGGLVARLLGRMGTLNRESFVLLLFTLASYRQPLPTAALSGITAIVSQHMGRMSSRELSQSMWAVAKLGHMDADMMDLATTVLPIKLKYAVPQDVSMTMCAFAELDYKNFALCEGYTDWAATRAQAFSATDLCNLVWACAELTFHPGLAQLNALLAEVDRRPGDFTAENRSTLKWAKRRLKSVYASKPQLDPEYERRRRSYSVEYESKATLARQRRISTIAEWYADESVYDYFEEEWGDVWW